MAAEKKPDQTPLSDLMARYLQQRTEAQTAGLVSAETTGEVVPFDAAPVQTVDPQLAWEEALAAVRHFEKSSPAKSKS
jgi:hypothetical protein